MSGGAPGAQEAMAEANLTSTARERRRAARGGQPARLARSSVSGRTSRSSSMPASSSRRSRSPTRPTARSMPSARNAVLVCHALTGDQHVASEHPVTGKPGWWETMVGPGKPIDTDRYFVICPNVVGGCMGTTGPASTDPATGKPWGARISGHHHSATWCARRPCCSIISASTRCSAVAGGSMGGMQVLQWAASYPRARVRGAADRLRHPPFGAEHRLSRGRPPGDHGRSGMARRPLLSDRRHRSAHRGLAVARMAAHITYLSDAALHRKFGRKFQDRDKPDLLVRRGFPGRILSAPSGHFLRRAFRRQFLSLSHARHGLFRPRRRL